MLTLLVRRISSYTWDKARLDLAHLQPYFCSLLQEKFAALIKLTSIISSLRLKISIWLKYWQGKKPNQTPWGMWRILSRQWGNSSSSVSATFAVPIVENRDWVFWKVLGTSPLANTDLLPASIMELRSTLFPMVRSSHKCNINIHLSGKTHRLTLEHNPLKPKFFKERDLSNFHLTKDSMSGCNKATHRELNWSLFSELILTTFYIWLPCHMSPCWMGFLRNT